MVEASLYRAFKPLANTLHLWSMLVRGKTTTVISCCCPREHHVPRYPPKPLYCVFVSRRVLSLTCALDGVVLSAVLGRVSDDDSRSWKLRLNKRGRNVSCIHATRRDSPDNETPSSSCASSALAAFAIGQSAKATNEEHGGWDGSFVMPAATECQVHEPYRYLSVSE